MSPFALLPNTLRIALSKIPPKYKKCARVDSGFVKWLTKGRSTLIAMYVNVKSKNGKLCQFVPVDVQEWQKVQIQNLCEVAFQYWIGFLLLLDQLFFQSQYHLIECFILISHSEDLKL